MKASEGIRARLTATAVRAREMIVTRKKVRIKVGLFFWKTLRHACHSIALHKKRSQQGNSRRHGPAKSAAARTETTHAQTKVKANICINGATLQPKTPVARVSTNSTRAKMRGTDGSSSGDRRTQTPRRCVSCYVCRVMARAAQSHGRKRRKKLKMHWRQLLSHGAVVSSKLLHRSDAETQNKKRENNLLPTPRKCKTVTSDMTD